MEKVARPNATIPGNIDIEYRKPGFNAKFTQLKNKLKMFVLVSPDHIL